MGAVASKKNFFRRDNCYTRLFLDDEDNLKFSLSSNVKFVNLFPFYFIILSEI